MITSKITYSCGEATGKVHLEVALEIEKNGDEDDELRDVDKHLPVL